MISGKFARQTNFTSSSIEENEIFDGIFEEIEYMIYHPSLYVIKISIIFKK